MTANPTPTQTHEYDLPDDIVEALRTRQVLPTADFGPPPFATLRRSVYKHTQPRERLHEEDVSVCFCTAAGGGCDERCQNRAMLQECDPSTCPTGALCRNRPFSTLGPASRWPVQLFKTIDKGWGVMATRDIYEGERLASSTLAGSSTHTSTQHPSEPRPRPEPRLSPRRTRRRVCGRSDRQGELGGAQEGAVAL